MPLHTIELLNIFCIVCEKPPIFIEKANTETETTFSTTDVFTYSMQGFVFIYFCS